MVVLDFIMVVLGFVMVISELAMVVSGFAMVYSDILSSILGQLGFAVSYRQKAVNDILREVRLGVSRGGRRPSSAAILAANIKAAEMCAPEEGPTKG